MRAQNHLVYEKRKDEKKNYLKTENETEIFVRYLFVQMKIFNRSNYCNSLKHMALWIDNCNNLSTEKMHAIYYYERNCVLSYKVYISCTFRYISMDYCKTMFLARKRQQHKQSIQYYVSNKHFVINLNCLSFVSFLPHLFQIFHQGFVLSSVHFSTTRADCLLGRILEFPTLRGRSCIAYRSFVDTYWPAQSSIWEVLV